MTAPLPPFPTAGDDAAPLRVAAYCRVSTDHEDQANSFENQKRYFQSCILRQTNWTMAGIYADEGITGTSTRRRKGFRRMIAEAQTGQFDLILTKEISRFARNTLDSIYYTRLLKKIGVGVFFLSDNLNTLDPDAELRLTILSSIAQEESRRTSQRVKWGQTRQMERGVVFGHSLLGYEVKDGKLLPEPRGAQLVRLIFAKFLKEQKGTFVIARELNESGCPTATGSAWSAASVLRVLRNEKYCGDLIQKKTYTPDYLTHEKKRNLGQEAPVRLKDHHVPIISRETFEQAGALLNLRAACQTGIAKHSERYGFSGKLRCGLCGANYVARRKKRLDGSRCCAWQCGRAAAYQTAHTDETGLPLGNRGFTVHSEEIVSMIRAGMAALAPEEKTLFSSLHRCFRDGLQVPAERLSTLDDAVRDLLSGRDLEESFYGKLLDHAVLFGTRRAELSLQGIRGVWILEERPGIPSAAQQDRCFCRDRGTGAFGDGGNAGPSADPETQ